MSYVFVVRSSPNIGRICPRLVAPALHHDLSEFEKDPGLLVKTDVGFTGYWSTFFWDTIDISNIIYMDIMDILIQFYVGFNIHNIQLPWILIHINCHADSIYGFWSRILLDPAVNAGYLFRVSIILDGQNLWMFMLWQCFFWCVLRREFSGMIWRTINFIIPATPGSPWDGRIHPDLKITGYLAALAVDHQ